VPTVPWLIGPVRVPVHGIRRRFRMAKERCYESARRRLFRPSDENTAANHDLDAAGVMREVTGSNAYLGRPVAGKTGTSEKNRDLWFLGYIPQLATGCLIGPATTMAAPVASCRQHRRRRSGGCSVGQLMDKTPVQQFPDLPRLGGRRGIVQAQPVDSRIIAEESSTPLEVPGL
jgi:penicillin-binding protein 1A